MEMNKCEGCKFDLTNRVAKDEKELISIMDRCGKCKREKLEEYKNGYKDLYLKNRNENNLITGDRVHISGDSDELWIKDYHVSVDTNATVMKTPNKHAKKILLTLDSIDGEENVCCLVRKSKVELSR